MSPLYYRAVNISLPLTPKRQNNIPNYEHQNWGQFHWNSKHSELLQFAYIGTKWKMVKVWWGFGVKQVLIPCHVPLPILPLMLNHSVLMSLSSWWKNENAWSAARGIKLLLRGVSPMLWKFTKYGAIRDWSVYKFICIIRKRPGLVFLHCNFCNFSSISLKM